MKGIPMIRPLSSLVVVALLGALAACGSDKAATDAAATDTGASSTDAARPSGGPGGGQFPGAFGEIAAVQGRTLQVQNQQSGQVAVTYSASTMFSQTVATTLKKIKKGDCVTAVAPSGTSSAAKTFTATRITVTAPVNGTCTGGFGGQQPTGARPSGMPRGGSPTGAPSGGFPTGAPGGGQAPGGQGGSFGTIASGQVRSVSGSKIVIAARQFNSTSRRPVTVSSAGSTKITTMATATAKSLQVGKCVTAQGSTNSSGTVKATRIQVAAATNGQCTLGFGGPNGQ
jgi:hypothetical protein